MIIEVLARICRGELAEYCCGYAFANIRIVFDEYSALYQQKKPRRSLGFFEKNSFLDYLVTITRSVLLVPLADTVTK